MNLYIWDRVENATNSYHSEGGIAVIAESLDRARELIAENTKQREWDEDESRPSICEALKTEPNLIREGCSGPEHISIFPDAGCC